MIAALTEQLESAEEELKQSRNDNQELLQAVTTLEEEKADTEAGAEEVTTQLESMFEEMSTLNESLEKAKEEKELLQKEHWEQSKKLQPLLQIEKEYTKQAKLKEWLEVEKKEKAALAAELKQLRAQQAAGASEETARLLQQLETEREERTTLIENMKREVRRPRSRVCAVYASSCPHLHGKVSHLLDTALISRCFMSLQAETRMKDELDDALQRQKKEEEEAITAQLAAKEAADKIAAAQLSANKERTEATDAEGKAAVERAEAEAAKAELAAAEAKLKAAQSSGAKEEIERQFEAAKVAREKHFKEEREALEAERDAERDKCEAVAAEMVLSEEKWAADLAAAVSLKEKAEADAASIEVRILKDQTKVMSKHATIMDDLNKAQKELSNTQDELNTKEGDLMDSQERENKLSAEVKKLKEDRLAELDKQPTFSNQHLAELEQEKHALQADNAGLLSEAVHLQGLLEVSQGELGVLQERYERQKARMQEYHGWDGLAPQMRGICVTLKEFVERQCADMQVNGGPDAVQATGVAMRVAEESDGIVEQMKCLERSLQALLIWGPHWVSVRRMLRDELEELTKERDELVVAVAELALETQREMAAVDAHLQKERKNMKEQLELEVLESLPKREPTNSPIVGEALTHAAENAANVTHFERALRRANEENSKAVAQISSLKGGLDAEGERVRLAREKALKAEEREKEARREVHELGMALEQAQQAIVREQGRAATVEEHLMETREHTAKLLLAGAAQRDATVSEHRKVDVLTPVIPDPKASAHAVVVMKSTPHGALPALEQELSDKLASIMSVMPWRVEVNGTWAGQGHGRSLRVIIRTTEDGQGISPWTARDKLIEALVSPTTPKEYIDGWDLHNSLLQTVGEERAATQLIVKQYRERLEHAQREIEVAEFKLKQVEDATIGLNIGAATLQNTEELHHELAATRAELRRAEAKLVAEMSQSRHRSPSVLHSPVRSPEKWTVEQKKKKNSPTYQMERDVDAWAGYSIHKVAPRVRDMSLPKPIVSPSRKTNATKDDSPMPTSKGTTFERSEPSSKSPSRLSIVEEVMRIPASGRSRSRSPVPLPRVEWKIEQSSTPTLRPTTSHQKRPLDDLAEMRERRSQDVSRSRSPGRYTSPLRNLARPNAFGGDPLIAEKALNKWADAAEVPSPPLRALRLLP